LNEQEVVCPYCGDRFLFLYEDSDEYQLEKHQQPDAHAPAGCRWLNWAAVAAVVAMVGFVALRLVH
jgi:hypothetical protein